MAGASNLGATRLRKRSHAENPMRAFDALPSLVRGWMAQAALPWSPASCRRIWHTSRAAGENEAALIARLDRAERKTLARDGPDAPMLAPLNDEWRGTQDVSERRMK